MPTRSILWLASVFLLAWTPTEVPSFRAEIDRIVAEVEQAQ